MVQHKANSLRIIGGRFRGRKISFPDLPNIRPTPDRVRETLFNWLQTAIVDSVCLDLFCGSGALGLEAISRGAAQVFAFDKEKKIIEHLKKIATELQLTHYQLVQKEIPFELMFEKDSVDIIFLDPPFRQDFACMCLTWIAESKILKSDGLVYLETEWDFELPLLEQWEIIKEKTAGQVCYRLLKPVVKEK